MTKKTKWTKVIEPRGGWFDIKLKELIRYRDLIKIFVYRDFVVFYKQTILGPLWFFIKPLLTTLIFTLVFSNIAKIPTDQIPPVLFYLAGITVWNYFASCLNNTSNTFTTNAQLFGKVYFPRMVIPISVVFSQLIQFAIQFALFLGVLFYFYLQGAAFKTSLLFIILTPLLLLHLAALGLGCGMIVSSLVTKYRDLTFLMEFGVQLWMYATPIVYPLSQIPAAWQKWYILNPMVSIVEVFRSLFLGTPMISTQQYAISLSMTVLILTIGIITFSKVEKSFVDNV